MVICISSSTAERFHKRFHEVRPVVSGVGDPLGVPGTSAPIAAAYVLVPSGGDPRKNLSQRSPHWRSAPPPTTTTYAWWQSGTSRTSERDAAIEFARMVGLPDGAVIVLGHVDDDDSTACIAGQGSDRAVVCRGLLDPCRRGCAACRASRCVDVPVHRSCWVRVGGWCRRKMWLGLLRASAARWRIACSRRQPAVPPERPRRTAAVSARLEAVFAKLLAENDQPDQAPEAEPWAQPHVAGRGPGRTSPWPRRSHLWPAAWPTTPRSSWSVSSALSLTSRCTRPTPMLPCPRRPVQGSATHRGRVPGPRLRCRALRGGQQPLPRTCTGVPRRVRRHVPRPRQPHGRGVRRLAGAAARRPSCSRRPAARYSCQLDTCSPTSTRWRTSAMARLPGRRSAHRARARSGRPNHRETGVTPMSCRSCPTTCLPKTCGARGTQRSKEACGLDPGSPRRDVRAGRRRTKAADVLIDALRGSVMGCGLPPALRRPTPSTRAPGAAPVGHGAGCRRPHAGSMAGWIVPRSSAGSSASTSPCSCAPARCCPSAAPWRTASCTERRRSPMPGLPRRWQRLPTSPAGRSGLSPLLLAEAIVDHGGLWH